MNVGRILLAFRLATFKTCKQLATLNNNCVLLKVVWLMHAKTFLCGRSSLCTQFAKPCILPNISQSKNNQKIKFGQLMKYKNKIFLQKSYWKWGRETSFRWVIPCQIIQGMTTLPLRFCLFFHYLKSVEMLNPWKLQPSTQYWDLKIWLKWVFGKICHFEFTFCVIAIVLVILSSWNLVYVSFLR